MSSSSIAVRTVAGHRPGRAPDRPDMLWQQVTDSLDCKVAVLERRGTIVAANEAWHQLAAIHGVFDGFVGASYLDVCRATDGDPWAERAYEGLCDVLAGSRASFTLAYPCDERWFSMAAVSMHTSHGLRVVVTHVDITVEHAAQQEVVSTRNFLAAVTDSMGEGLIALDARGRVTLLNASAESLLGWSAQELLGRRLHELTLREHTDGTPYDVDTWPIRAERQQGVAIRTQEDTFSRRDGSALAVSYTAAPLSSPDGLDGCVVVFTDATAQRAERDRLLAEAEASSRVRRVRAAIDEHRLVLYGQPIVDLNTGETGPIEVLLRVIEEDGTVAAPGPYLATAEKHGLIGEIDRWVIQESIKLAAAGRCVELNISGLSVGDRSLVPQIAGWLDDSGADPSRLVFEITETALIADQESAYLFVQQIRALGCRVALDDFGTGYGGFTYLKNLPVDYLKIDIEFVLDLTREASSRHVVEAVVSLASGFALTTIAEGVEDAETQELLRQLGVGFGQGFHVGRPTPLTTPGALD